MQTRTESCNSSTFHRRSSSNNAPPGKLNFTSTLLEKSLSYPPLSLLLELYAAASCDQKLWGHEKVEIVDTALRRIYKSLRSRLRKNVKYLEIAWTKVYIEKRSSRVEFKMANRNERKTLTTTFELIIRFVETKFV